MAVDSPYLTVKTQSTIVGTRLGASSAATFAVMKYFGRQGYCRLANEMMGNTNFLYEQLLEIGYEVVCKPELNIVAFNHPNIETDEFAEKLEDLGWKVSVAKCPKSIRIVLMNHIKRDHIKELLEDLKELY
jgi:tyrosine decarboxylase/aspartate 1-decarboxylase